MPLRARGIDFSELDLKIDHLVEHSHHVATENVHETHIWPSQPNVNAVLTAGAVANNWSVWQRLRDSGGSAFHHSDHNVHISALELESASAGTDIYFIELAYGADMTTITRLRFSSASIGQLPPLHLLRIRSVDVPTGERLYYRCKCSTGGSTVNIALRWHEDYVIATPC